MNISTQGTNENHKTTFVCPVADTGICLPSLPYTTSGDHRQPYPLHLVGFCPVINGNGHRLASLAASVWWYRTNDPGQDRLPLRLATAVVFLHAFRVLIFVLGRTGPWINFDFRPEFHATHGERWSWTWVWFAAIMSILSMATVLLIWLIRRRKRKNR